MPTPQPWRSGTTPNPIQATQWFLSCPLDEQTEVMGNLIHNSTVASQCIAEDHERYRGVLADVLVRVGMARKEHLPNGKRECVAGCGRFPCKTAKAVYLPEELSQ